MTRAIVNLIDWATKRAALRFTLRCLGVEPRWHWSIRRLELEVKEVTR